MGLLIISVLALLNIFSDIFKYKMNFVNEKRHVRAHILTGVSLIMNSFISVDYYPVIMAFIAVAKLASRCARFLRKLKKVTFRR